MTTANKGAIGMVDRILRASVGAGLIVFAIMSAQSGAPVGTIEIAAGIAGLILVATAVFKFCPIYRLIGICTE